MVFPVSVGSCPKRRQLVEIHTVGHINSSRDGQKVAAEGSLKGSADPEALSVTEEGNKDWSLLPMSEGYGGCH